MKRMFACRTSWIRGAACGMRCGGRGKGTSDQTRNGRGSKLNHRRGKPQVFGPCFLLPGFHFCTGFVSHSQCEVAEFRCEDGCVGEAVLRRGRAILKGHCLRLADLQGIWEARREKKSVGTGHIHQIRTSHCRDRNSESTSRSY